MHECRYEYNNYYAILYRLRIYILKLYINNINMLCQLHSQKTDANRFCRANIFRITLYGLNSNTPNILLYILLPLQSCRNSSKNTRNIFDP